MQSSKLGTLCRKENEVAEEPKAPKTPKITNSGSGKIQAEHVKLSNEPSKSNSDGGKGNQNGQE